MPNYILLVNYTDQGIRDIKGTPQRTSEVYKILEAAGGKMVGDYLVMGQYDRVAIIEAPNDEVAMTFLLRLNSRGNIRTTTLRAFTKEQTADIVKRLP